MDKLFEQDSDHPLFQIDTLLRIQFSDSRSLQDQEPCFQGDQWCFNVTANSDTSILHSKRMFES